MRAQGQRHEGTQLPLLGISAEVRQIPAEMCVISGTASPPHSSWGFFLRDKTLPQQDKNLETAVAARVSCWMSSFLGLIWPILLQPILLQKITKVSIVALPKDMEGEDRATPPPAPDRNISNASPQFVSLTTVKLTPLNKIPNPTQNSQKHAKRNSQRGFSKMTFISQTASL